MADNDRVVFPEEAAEMQSNSIEENPQIEAQEDSKVTPVEEPKASGEAVKVTLRNMIQVPPNCPDGWEMGADGICREVF